MSKSKPQFVYLMINRQLSGLAKKWIIKVGHSSDYDKRAKNILAMGDFLTVVAFEISSEVEKSRAERIEKGVQSRLSEFEGGKHIFREAMECFVTDDLDKVIAVFEKYIRRKWSKDLVTKRLIDLRMEQPELMEEIIKRQVEINFYKPYEAQYKIERRGMEEVAMLSRKALVQKGNILQLKKIVSKTRKVVG